MTPSEIAEKFQQCDVHDDTVESFVIHPAKTGVKLARVEVVLYRHWKQTWRLLTLSRCKNIQFEIDATVLYENTPSNTCCLEATSDLSEIEALIIHQKKQWNLEYEAAIDPLQKKLEHAGKYVLFRIRLFGGTLSVIAQSYKLKRLQGDMRVDA